MSGKRSTSSRASSGSARHRALSRMKVSQGADDGRVLKGTSSATARPLTVTLMCSPASTRRSTALTSFRSSRAGISITTSIVASLLRSRFHQCSERRAQGSTVRIRDRLLHSPIAGQSTSEPQQGGSSSSLGRSTGAKNGTFFLCINPCQLVQLPS